MDNVMLRTNRSVLDLKEERRRSGAPLQTVYGEVIDLGRRFEVHERELRLSNSLSQHTDGERHLIKSLLTRYRDLPLAERRRRPALLNAVGKLAVIAGEWDGARRDFQELVTLVTDPKAQAEAHYNAYVVALERSQWTQALAALLQAIPLDPVRLAPFPTSKYAPLRILGAGGFCVAFLCRHQVTQSNVVIKAMLANDSQDDRAKLITEARFLDELTHPAIVQLRDCDVMNAGNNVRPYLVMDYFEGPTLEEYVRANGPLGSEDLLALAHPVAGALRAAHARGIVHCDVKPGNILVRREGSGWRVMLIDFGLASRVDPEAWKRPGAGGQSGRIGPGIVGTLDYAAPEQLGRLPGAAIGSYSDVYGFGRTCHFGLLGSAQPTEQQRATLPASWRKLLGRCTQLDIAERIVDFAPVLAMLSRMRAKARITQRKQKALAYQHSAQVSSDHGAYDKTIADLTRALQLDPKLATALNNRGVAYSNRGELGLAIADFNEALRLDPDFAQAYHNRGLAHASQGTYLQAISDFTEALSLGGGDAATYHFRGMAYGNQGDFDLAVADFTAAIRLKPDDPWPYYHRSSAYAQKGESELAKRDYEEAARLDPRSGQERAL
jgi:serine/threonine protein kinase